MKTEPRLMIHGLLCALFLLAPAQGAVAAAAGKPEVTVRAEAVSVDGQRYAVLWRLDAPAGWHFYSQLRNDTGFPPSPTVEWPAGVRAGALQWPAAERYVSAGEILDHVYHGSVTLVQDFVVPPELAAGGTEPIPVRWDWLVCRDLCVPGHATTSVVFDAPASPEALQAVAAARAALPTAAPDGALNVAWREAAVTITVPGAAHVEFQAAEDCAQLVDAITDAEAAGDSLTLRLRSGAEGYGPLRGILKQKLSDGSSRSWTVDIPYGGRS